jgi:REP element-mobilizing transposase RayT
MAVGKADSFPCVWLNRHDCQGSCYRGKKSVIYFVTMCVKDRRRVLANPDIFDAIKITIAQLQKWRVLADVVMPDHAHWVVLPVQNRDLSVGDFSHGFKRLLRKSLGSQLWEWQRGCFDRLLRSEENLWSKWIYVKDNPVRHGLVQKADDWPYYLDFIYEHGELTASPTEMRGCGTVQRQGGR